MAQWMKFSDDFDYRWPSRAVTAFKAGMIVYVKDTVAEAAKAEGKATPTDKPASDDDSYRATHDPMESGPTAIPGNPDPDSAEAESIRIQAGGEPPAVETPPAGAAPAKAKTGK